MLLNTVYLRIMHDAFQGKVDDEAAVSRYVIFKIK